MASSVPTPRISQNKQNNQSSYELHHRIYGAKSYPIKSPNGSSIILYGHENGVRILWRGGRHFKESKTDQASPQTQKSNGAEGAVILLDSDDEDASALNAFEDKPEFEDEEEELDSSSPLPSIVQDLHLYFGSEVLEVSLLPTPILTVEGISRNGIAKLREKIIFAAACSDNSVRLVTLPLNPPSPASKARAELSSNFVKAHAGNGTWGETMVVLNGSQKPPSSIAMTVEFPGNAYSKRGISESENTADALLVVAAHSSEISGFVRLYRIAAAVSKPGNVEPFQSVHLSAPATNISFNPNHSGAESSQLLISDNKGACRIYDYRSLPKAQSGEDQESSSPEQGSWLLSLYAGFLSSKGDQAAHPNSMNAGFGRKAILDAQWICRGKAVIVLLNDGEWGIWDIDGVGPGAAQGLLGRQGVKCGSCTEFSLTGYIEGGKPPRVAGAPQNFGSKFAPMTPSTRKTLDLFGGRTQTGPVTGRISVTEIPSSSPTNAPQESVVFWLGETFAVVSNISRYWASNVGKGAAVRGGGGSLFNGSAPDRMMKLGGLDLQGERCSGVDQIIKAPTSTGLATDILIVCEHRFIILASKRPSSRPQVSERTALSEGSLRAGDLDVSGIEEALSRMGNGSGNGNGNGTKKRAMQS